MNNGQWPRSKNFSTFGQFTWDFTSKSSTLILVKNRLFWYFSKHTVTILFFVRTFIHSKSLCWISEPSRNPLGPSLPFCKNHKESRNNLGFCATTVGHKARERLFLAWSFLRMITWVSISFLSIPESLGSASVFGSRSLLWGVRKELVWVPIPFRGSEGNAWQIQCSLSRWFMDAKCGF